MSENWKLLARTGARSEIAARLFALIGVLWLGMRLFPSPPQAPASVVSQVEGISVQPGSSSGRLEVRGGPRRHGDLNGLFEIPLAEGALLRLETEVARANEWLGVYAQRISGRVDVVDPGALAVIRVSGLTVPFQDRDARRLETAQRVASERPWTALEEMADVFDARLSEPTEGFDLEGSALRRDLTRLLREIQSELEHATSDTQLALAAFRREALDAAKNATGPFHRRGRGLIVEVLFAALLGTALRESLRRGEPRHSAFLVVPAAALLSTGLVLLLEGTAFLPVDPITGISIVFVPVAFAIGTVTSPLLERLTRSGTAEAPRIAPGSRAETSLPEASRESVPTRERPMPEREATVPAAKPAPRPKTTPEPNPEPAPEPARPRFFSPATRPRRKPRSEREIPEDPGLARPLPGTPIPGSVTDLTPPGPSPEPPTEDGFFSPPAKEKLPFFRRR